MLDDPIPKAATADATTTYTRVYNIDSPTPGKWKLKVPVYAGEYSFIAKVFSESTIDFAAYFLHQERKGGPVVSVANPLSGKDYSLHDLDTVHIGDTRVDGGGGSSDISFRSERSNELGKID